MKFDKVLPLTVKGCLDGSNASELGVQPGWVFKNINGKEITPTMSVEEVIALISQGSQSLP